MPDKYALTNLSIDEIPSFSGSPASGDYLLMWDASQGTYVKMDATRVTFA